MILRVVFFVACIFFCLSATAKEEEMPTLRVEGGSDGYVLSAHHIPHNGRPVAFFLLLSLPEGGDVVCLTVDMTLTSEVRDGRLTVLLDGLLSPQKGDDGIPLLRSDSPVVVEEATFYVMGADGRVEEVAMVIRNQEPTDETATEALTETPTETTVETTALTVPPETRPSPPETTTAPPADTSPETVPPAPPDAPPAAEQALATYVGCRETRVSDGTFDIQFLFSDKENTTPTVICIRGAGVLSMEVGRAEVEGKVWQTLTLRGVLSDREYRFWVFTDGGTVEVVYREGTYIGQEKTPRGAFFQLFSYKTDGSQWS